MELWNNFLHHLHNPNCVWKLINKIGKPGAATFHRDLRRPLSENDLRSEYYQKGVSCSYCYGVSSDSDKERFAQRQKQIELAELRGHEHMGARAKQKK